MNVIKLPSGKHCSVYSATDGCSVEFVAVDWTLNIVLKENTLRAYITLPGGKKRLAKTFTYKDARTAKGALNRVPNDIINAWGF